MKHHCSRIIWLVITLVGMLTGIVLLPSGQSSHAADTAPVPQEKTIAELTAEIEKLKSVLPDQSHAMADVGYHMAHAWFAAQAKNWTLTKFYVDETRSHIGWAVRLKPVRKGPGGVEFSLQPFADAVTNGPLTELKASIEKQDAPKFEIAYQATLNACYACHTASDKPYLRLHIPSMPESGIIDNGLPQK